MTRASARAGSWWLSTNNNSFSRIRNSSVPGRVRHDSSSRESGAAALIMVGESSIPSEATAISIVYRRQHIRSSESTARQLTLPHPGTREQPRHRLEPRGIRASGLPNRARTLLPEGVDVQDPRSSVSVGIGPDAHHRDQLHRRIPVGGIRMQLLGLELPAPRMRADPSRAGCNARAGLGWLLVGWATSSPNARLMPTEQPVSLRHNERPGPQRSRGQHAQVCCGSRR